MEKKDNRPWQSRLHDVIYESNTTPGKTFDITLLILIVASILVVMLDSMSTTINATGIFFISWNGASQSCLLSSTSCVW